MKKILLSTFIFLFLFINTTSVFAAGLVICGGKGQASCTLCDLLNLGKTVVDQLVSTFVPAIALLMLTIAGAMFFLGGANPGMVKRARELMISIVIGLVVIYGAWLIVNTFFMMIGLNEAGTFGFDLKQWWNFPCE